MLSCVDTNTPPGVVNCGIAVPVTNILNVLSRILFKLSVALIVKVESVFETTNAGVPDNTPVLVSFEGNTTLVNIILSGKVPAKTW